MQQRLIRIALGGALASVTGLAGAAPSAAAPVPQIDVTPQASAATPASASQLRVPHWTGRATVGATTYHYLMLGRNPTVVQATPVTTLKVVHVTTRVQLLNADGTVAATFDPTLTGRCVPPGETVTSMILKSPVFTPTDLRFAGVSFGHMQYAGGFQRGEFWPYTNPSTGINPGYAVNLKPRVALTLTARVPDGQWQTVASSACPASGLAGIVSLNWFDGWATNTAFPTIRTAATNAGISADNYIALFTTWNVHFSANQSTGIGGWHGWLPDPATGDNVPYATSDYDTSGATSFHDVYALTHEISELINDPFVNDPTPAWGHIGQVAGCKRILEVGDPVTGTTITLTSNGYSFTVQDLMFAPWFYQQPAPTGSYDFFGTITNAAAACV